MTGSATARAVRRSAIESRHAALGARWLADDVRWPAGYERLTGGPGTRVRLAEIGPFEEWLVRGPGALDATTASLAGATTQVGRVVTGASGTDLEAWILGPDEVLLLAPVGAANLAAEAGSVASGDVSVIDMTGARTTIRLVGPAAPALLAELCPADTRPASLPEGGLIQAPVAGVRAFITRRDATGEPGYILMIARDEAAYAWDSIRHIGEPHGLAVVGPDGVTEAAS